ncbi:MULTISPECIES: hypothetical protein [Bacillaceae]|uniref:Uncharacterized protein n=2 Tax=Bacillus infantis TaxID=324767 RepID=U5LEQ1_9BACI|nr:MULTISPECIES: hypothetical protein [Bacillus]OXT19492.1 hypothetical protein B9K06_03840 [Bacillus sp. OG2]AGX05082.1 hypothetical protein N288_15965 [Bacillus infantis NRRL B-14911]EAR66480.1 hypothetical protein B14911_23032 [Bacillus sp. NRRL B-14911]MCK6204832.1 hypothetical protein [Bacillus infantis]MDW2880058.1 hypothetical protein [Bacillus infantis]
MNIQKHYSRLADLSLNSSLAALVPLFFILPACLVMLPGRELVLAAVPFLLYSFGCYQMSVLHQARSRAVDRLDSCQYHGKLLEENHLLVSHLPSASLRMVLFTPDGQLAGELRDSYVTLLGKLCPSFLSRSFQREYGLYNRSGNLMILFLSRKNKVDIFRADRRYIGTMQFIHKPGGSAVIRFRQKTLSVRREKFFLDCRIGWDGGKELMSYKKGLMPVSWAEKFQNPNMEVMAFNDNAGPKERILALAAIAKLFADG